MPAQMRTSLESDITIVVGQEGSLQDEYDRLATDFDMRGFSASFVLDGTPSPTLNAHKPLVGGNHISVNGLGMNIAGIGKPALSNHVAGLVMDITNVRLSGWSGGSGVAASEGATINLKEWMIFCNGDGDHILAYYGGRIFIQKDYTVEGGGLNHWHSFSDGYITATDLKVSINSGIWFTRWAGVADASIIARNVVYQGTINGSQYLVHRNGFMEIGNAVLPGNVAGTVLTGGVVG